MSELRLTFWMHFNTLQRQQPSKNQHIFSAHVWRETTTRRKGWIKTYPVHYRFRDFLGALLTSSIACFRYFCFCSCALVSKAKQPNRGLSLTNVMLIQLAESAKKSHMGVRLLATVTDSIQKLGQLGSTLAWLFHNLKLKEIWIWFDLQHFNNLIYIIWTVYKHLCPVYACDKDKKNNQPQPTIRYG